MKVRVLLLSILFGILLLGCTETETPTKAIQTSTPPVQKISTPTPKPTQEILKLRVGETAKTSTREVTVKSATITHTIAWTGMSGTTYTEKAPDGMKFLIIEVEVRNLDQERLYVAASDFKVSDAEGYSYDVSGKTFIYLKDSFPMFVELYKGERKKGRLMYEIPENARGLQVKYDFASILEPVKLAIWEVNS
ncbi:hypothetical protein DRP05_06705 [Archaeoglobales archaeon]|nr:MAG: hypothetical protein DRP05_06705 [Archaeoglobales archaeon]